MRKDRTMKTNPNALSCQNIIFPNYLLIIFNTNDYKRRSEMVIEKLILENYASIWTALKSKRIEIDFSNRKNRICLLCAPNGGGKTSILSALTPFATLGNLDVRDTLPIITVGKKGYKEVVIRDGSTRYTIKHYYTPNGDKGTHSVKSYIEKDGTELNPNGNVTSFKDIVNQELDLEMDYLKLVRLGNNVTNLLDMKTTERKNFMSKLLDEVDIYLKYNKKISKDLLEMKAIINHTLDKVRKTGISDLPAFEAETEDMESRLSEKKSELENCSVTISICMKDLEAYGDLEEKKALVRSLGKKLEKSNTDDPEAMLKQTREQREAAVVLMQKLSTDLVLATSHKNDLTKNLEDVMHVYDSTQLEYEKEVSSEDIRSYEKIIRDLTLSVTSCEIRYKDQSFGYTKEELDEFGALVIRVNEILETSYSFGKEPVSRVVQLLKNGENVETYISKGIAIVSADEYENACRIVFQRFKDKYENLPMCQYAADCQYVAFYNEMSESSVERETRKYEESVLLLQTMLLVYQNIQTVFSIFHEKKELFDKMPEDIQKEFQLDLFMDRIGRCESIYPEKIFFSHLTEITEYTNYLSEKKELEEAKANLDAALNSSRVASLSKRLASLKERIDDISNEIDMESDRIEELSEKIADLSDDIDRYRGLEEIFENLDVMRTQYNTALNELTETMVLHERLGEAKRRKDWLTPEIGRLEKEIQFRRYTMQDYCKLKKDLEKYQEVYDDLDAIRYATSTKEGIPLFYIQMYLKDTREVTNELLDQVYDGRLYIDDFKINSDEFRIPFVRDGIEIKDASFASQGELSFLSIALSFALSAQSLTRYNIMLLDEIDGALDTKNREHFISILEYLLEMIHAEQVFVITHNNMFDMYPVDIINTNGSMDVPNHLANAIPVHLE